MLDLVPVEKPKVFIAETPARMMTFLTADVINNPLELRETILQVDGLRQVTPPGLGVLRARAYYKQTTSYGVSAQAPQGELIARMENVGKTSSHETPYRCFSFSPSHSV